MYEGPKKFCNAFTEKFVFVARKIARRSLLRDSSCGCASPREEVVEPGARSAYWQRQLSLWVHRMLISPTPSTPSPSRRPASDDDLLRRNPVFASGRRVSSEVIGAHTNVAPLVRPRPLNKSTAPLANPAIRNGRISSDHIGYQFGSRYRRPTSLHAPRTPVRLQTASDWSFASCDTSSSVIGSHTLRSYQARPPTVAIDCSARPEPLGGHCFDVESFQAARQKALLSTRRSDGSSMARESFDAAYSNAHTTKDTQSVLGPGFVPNLDPRRSMTRPSNLPCAPPPLAPVP